MLPNGEIGQWIRAGRDMVTYLFQDEEEEKAL
jgi:hypothetical protein